MGILKVWPPRVMIMPSSTTSESPNWWKLLTLEDRLAGIERTLGVRELGNNRDWWLGMHNLKGSYKARA